MDRCALFVDAGYVLADGAMAVHGTSRRESVSWDYAGLLEFLAALSADRAGQPLLRCYWYDTSLDGRRTAEHDALADLPGLMLRLGGSRPGTRDGADTGMHRDLTTLARNRAVSDVLLVSAEEDLAPVIADVQDLGVRVTIAHIPVDGNRAVSRPLRQQCDDVLEIDGTQLRPYAKLIAGAEPARYDEQYGASAYRGTPLANGHAGGPGRDRGGAAPPQPGPPAPPPYAAPASAAFTAAAAPSGPAAQELPAAPRAPGGAPAPAAPGQAADPPVAPPPPSGQRAAGPRPPYAPPHLGTFAGAQGSQFPPAAAGQFGSTPPGLPSRRPAQPAGLAGNGLPGQRSPQPPPPQAPPVSPAQHPATVPGPGYPPPVPYHAQPPEPPAAGAPGTPAAEGAPADIVQAAHSEGFEFGESVAHDAPALWLEAVLARKPRMPSDLEARLIEGSALPIDSLRHDQVRGALRRGFWDALDRSRR